MIRTVPQTGSTNADLVARISAGERIAEGEWRVADRQTAGRGRQGRTWFDGHGNFMGSCAVHSSARDPQRASLALVAGLAVYEAVLPYCPEPDRLSLKWPNDVMISGAKLAGILLEAQGDSTVIGIGVNLAAAPDLPDRKTMTLSQIGPKPDRDVFAASLAACFDRELERWRTYGLEPLIRRWESAAHPKGTQLTVHDSSKNPVSGQFDGLMPDGGLRLRLADGSTHAIHAGDVLLG